MDNKFVFSCGCSFPIINETIKDYDGLPSLDVDYYNVRLDCPRTYQLLASGRTRAVFQVETNFGKQYCKKLEPDNLNEICDLISILRPGCLQFKTDGLSMTDMYIERKHGRREIYYADEKIAKHLSSTRGIIVYQEQIISIAKDLAGFTPEQANLLRKNVGKKLMDKLVAMKEEFVNGCIEHSGMDKDVASNLFDNIAASGRYCFNLAHACTYSHITYLTAYMKAHFPLHFFCSALKYVKDEDELKTLIAELPFFDISLLPPKVSNLLSRFNITDGAIQYGIAEIRSCGKITAEKLTEHIIEAEKKTNKEAKDFTWYEFLTLVGPHINSQHMNNLILCGFFDVGVSRKTQLHEYNVFENLSDGETRWCLENSTHYSSLSSLLQNLLNYPKLTKRRKPKIESLILSLSQPGKSLDDDLNFICKNETHLLGVALSNCRTADKEKLSNIKCMQFLGGAGKANLKFVVEVREVFERTIKSGPNLGKKMANIKLADRSGEMELSIFSKEWAEFKKDVIPGNIILLSGSRYSDGNLKIDNINVL